MQTRVINRRVEKEDVYIGRGSPFGNRYRIGVDGTREEVIDKYREDFRYRIQNEPRFSDQVIKLVGFKLGCYCKPLACHGDVIVEWLVSNGWDID